MLRCSRVRATVSVRLWCWARDTKSDLPEGDGQARSEGQTQHSPRGMSICRNWLAPSPFLLGVGRLCRLRQRCASPVQAATRSSGITMQAEGLSRRAAFGAILAGAAAIPGTDISAHVSPFHSEAAVGGVLMVRCSPMNPRRCCACLLTACFCLQRSPTRRSSLRSRATPPRTPTCS